MNKFLFLFSYIKRHKYSYLAGIFFIFLTNWIAVTIPTYMKLSVDLLSQDTHKLQDNLTQLREYLLIMFALAVVAVFVRVCSRILFFNPGRAVEYQVKNDVFKKLTRLEKEYYDENPTGSIISRIQNDVTGIRLICGFGMMQVFNIISALSLTPYKMWQLSANLTLYCVLPILAVFLIVRIGMNYVVRFSRERMARLQDLSGFIVSSLSGIDVIKGFALTGWSLNKFAGHNDQLLDKSLKISFYRSFLMPVLLNLENILKVLVLFIGGLYVIEQDFTIGELTAFIAYAGLLTFPITGLGWLTTLFQQGVVGISSIETILGRPTPEDEMKNLPDETVSTLFDRGLKVENLCYRYPGQTQMTLENVSFEIKPGQTVGILGQVGAGKTTLINCINRHLKIDRGQVFIGDMDVTDISVADTRKIIRTVTQDPFLFSDSVEENIRFGQSGDQAPDEKLDTILFESALTEEVKRFPKNIHTMVGEKGIMLSGGQKQRISLARANVASCDLLILDNVLSAVDHETERFLLQHALKRKRSKSLLIVSHRVEALENADLIISLDNGKVAQRGTHQTLLKEEGLYRRTWEIQRRQESDD